MRGRFDRRALLRGLGGLALTAPWLGCGPSDSARTGGAGTRTGALTGDGEVWGLPRQQELPFVPTRRPEGVLEVFLLGGINPWDTFYTVPEHGDPARGGSYAGQQWWTFQSGPENLPDAFAACGGASRALYEPFGVASDGKTVNFGPFVYPLRDRPDILARMRLVVVSHDAEPHQTAVPYLMTGLPPGSPRAAGFAAHVSRHFGELTPREAPWATVILPQSVTVSALEAHICTTPGLHPGSARPLTVRMVPDNPLARDLSRPAYGTRRDAADAALAWYTERFAQRLTPAGRASPLRSHHFADYQLALESLRKTDVISGLFAPEVLALSPGTACGVTRDDDPTVAGLRLGRHLLTRPSDAPRYVKVVDTGLVEASNGGYDTHQHHIRDTSVSVVHWAQALADSINRPGENDPSKLDLDRHMVLITTEMGRTPFPQSGSELLLGLNHWPYGFACLSIGGPMTPGIAGAIGESGRATDFATPAEYRAGLLLALGIWPFSPEAFAVGHVREAKDELDAAARVAARVIGEVA